MTAGAWRSCCRPAAARHWHTLRVLLQPHPLDKTGERTRSKHCLQQLCLPPRLERAATEQAVQWFALLLCAPQLKQQAEPSRASTAHLQVRLQAPKLLLQPVSVPCCGPVSTITDYASLQCHGPECPGEARNDFRS